MSLSARASTVPGIDVRSTKINDQMITALKGPQKAVAKLIGGALREGYRIENFISFGISHDGRSIHFVGFDPSASQLVREAVLGETYLRSFHLRGFDYAHFIATMDGKVNVACFEDRFNPHHFNGKAFGNFAKCVFENGMAYDSKDGSNTILLLAPKGPRTLVASWRGYKGPLVAINHPIMDNEGRYAVVDANTLVAADYKTGLICAVTAEQISDHIQGAHLDWDSVEFNEIEIEDISLGIGKTSTVIITARVDGQIRYIPAWMGWPEDKFGVRLHDEDSVKLSSSAAPIVRATEDQVVVVDGGTAVTRMILTSPESYAGNELVTLINKATNGYYNK